MLVRRDVVNAAMEVGAYEFSLRGELHANVRARGQGVRAFLDRLLIDHIRSVNAAVLRERRVFIPFTEDSVRSSAMALLPAHACILLQPAQPRQPADPTLLIRLKELRDAGHEIWADDCVGSSWFSSAAEQLDGATVRVAMRMPLEISEAMDQLKQDYPHLHRGAWDVATMDEFETLRGLGCTQFSGGFVTWRGNWSGNALSPQVMCVATLVNQVREDADMRQIASVLRQDMAMSYKLLRYANSAARGLNHSLTSIEQALLVMGQAQLDRWLTLLLLGGGLGGNGAVLEAALVRARFMEILGRHYRQGELCEKLFVLGLFSMLDIALKVPLEDAIRPLNLPAPMRDALLDHSGVLGSFLALAEGSQEGDTDRVLRHAVALGLTVRKVNARLIEALTWVTAPEVTQANAEA
ncbi:EAL domain-containing protein [Viridibacterium curvum]|uniref:EAL domain-containing protein n=2 Tax=Viridibacterium curvum TaxID=1101404 RepID=A0ABP9QJ45_9RHOO